MDTETLLVSSILGLPNCTIAQEVKWLDPDFPIVDRNRQTGQYCRNCGDYVETALLLGYSRLTGMLEN